MVRESPGPGAKITRLRLQSAHARWFYPALSAQIHRPVRGRVWRGDGPPEEAPRPVSLVRFIARGDRPRGDDVRSLGAGSGAPARGEGRVSHSDAAGDPTCREKNAARTGRAALRMVFLEAPREVFSTVPDIFILKQEGRLAGGVCVCQIAALDTSRARLATGYNGRIACKLALISHWRGLRWEPTPPETIEQIIALRRQRPRGRIRASTTPSRDCEAL